MRLFSKRTFDSWGLASLLAFLGIKRTERPLEVVLRPLSPAPAADPSTWTATWGKISVDGHKAGLLVQNLYYVARDQWPYHELSIARLIGPAPVMKAFLANFADASKPGELNIEICDEKFKMQSRAKLTSALLMETSVWVIAQDMLLVDGCRFVADVQAAGPPVQSLI